LNIGIWSGDVRLKNLKLKKEALDKFRLPVDVKEGYLGDLTLSIPWNNVSLLVFTYRTRLEWATLAKYRDVICATLRVPHTRIAY
jgi:hypothetical protein